MHLISSLRSALLPTIASVCLIQLLSACGGGGIGDTPVTVNALVFSTANSKIDLKTADGSQRIAALGVSNSLSEAFFDRPGSANSAFASPSGEQSFPCDLGGTITVVITNSDSKPSVGDSRDLNFAGCKTSDSNQQGFSLSNGKITYQLEAVNGDATNPALTLESTSKLAAKLDVAFDNVVGGLRYQGTGTLSLTTSYSNKHDGKNTTSIADDIDGFSATTAIVANGTYGGQAYFLAANSASTNCEAVGFSTNSEITRCQSIEATITGKSLSLGDFNVRVATLSAITFDQNSIPVAGKISIIQFGETVTVEFSRSANGQPTVTVTSSAGVVTTLLFSELEALLDSTN